MHTHTRARARTHTHTHTHAQTHKYSHQQTKCSCADKWWKQQHTHPIENYNINVQISNKDKTISGCIVHVYLRTDKVACKLSDAGILRIPCEIYTSGTWISVRINFTFLFLQFFAKNKRNPKNRECKTEYAMKAGLHKMCVNLIFLIPKCKRYSKQNWKFRHKWK